MCNTVWMNDERTPSAPHHCPDCGEPAYVGGPGVPAQCTNQSCPFYENDCWVRWILELPDPGDPQEELEIDEEAETDPGFAVRSLLDTVKLSREWASEWIPVPESDEDKLARLRTLDLPKEIEKNIALLYKAETGAGLRCVQNRIHELDWALDKIRSGC